MSQAVKIQQIKTLKSSLFERQQFDYKQEEDISPCISKPFSGRQRSARGDQNAERGGLPTGRFFDFRSRGSLCGWRQHRQANQPPFFCHSPCQPLWVQFWTTFFPSFDFENFQPFFFFLQFTALDLALGDPVLVSKMKMPSLLWQLERPQSSTIPLTTCRAIFRLK